MVDNPAGEGRTWTRILVTLPLLAVFRLAALLPLPGVNTSSLERLGGPSRFSVIALGITPFVTGFVVVELLSFILVVGGKLRRGGIAGRSKLNAFSIRVGLWLALVQAAADIPAADRRAGWGKGGTEIPDYFLSCPA